MSLRTLFIPMTMAAILACGGLPALTSEPPTASPSATPAPPATSTASPAPQTGTVTGRLSYPSSFIPPMRVVFFSVPDGQPAWVDTAMNQGMYSIELPPGTYYAVAYPFSADTYTPPAPGAPTLAGGYTPAVACGLSVNCTDHTLAPVVVTAGQSVSVDPGDWYAPEGTFPPMPSP